MKCSRGFLCIWRWACGAGTSAKGWHFAVDKMPTATATPNNFFKSKVKFYRGPNGQQKTVAAPMDGWIRLQFGPGVFYCLSGIVSGF